MLVLAPWWLHRSLLGLGSLPSWCFSQSHHAYFFLVERYVISERKPLLCFCWDKAHTVTCVTPVPCWALTLALACMAGFLLPAWCPHALSTQQLRSCFRIQATQPTVLKVSMTAVTCLPLWPTSSSIVRSLLDHASPSCSSAMLASCVPAPGPLHRLLLELFPPQMSTWPILLLPHISMS